MAYDNSILATLREQVARKKHLEHSLESLNRQKYSLNLQVSKLEALMINEQNDVNKLKKPSLAAFYYNVVGRLDEKLDKERAEAYAARVKYDTVAQSLAAIEADLIRVSDELDTLRDCENAYNIALGEKLEAIKASNSPEAVKIRVLEDKLTYIYSQQIELREAISAGEHAKITAEQVLTSLRKADDYATWDMFGGGFIADMAKHDHLDAAQNQVNILQTQLNRFKTELADVSVHADIQASLDGFSRFADYFFDGIFVDWTVRDHINKASSQARNTLNQIDSVLRKLSFMSADADKRYKQTKAELDNAILQVNL